MREWRGKGEEAAKSDKGGEARGWRGMLGGGATRAEIQPKVESRASRQPERLVWAKDG